MAPTVTVPNQNDVRDGVVYGNRVGNLRVPPAYRVEKGFGYGSYGTELIGTMIPAAQIQLPPPNKVEAGYKYGLNGTEFTGTLVVSTTPPITPSGTFDANIVKVKGEDVVPCTTIDANITQLNGVAFTPELVNKFIASLG